MKKAVIIMAVLAGLALGVQAEKYVTVGVAPGTNNVATITQSFAAVAIPVAIYTDLNGTTTNAVTIGFTPSVATNAADYGKTYRIGSFSTVGGAEATVVLNDPLNTNSAGTVIMNRGDVLPLTGAGGTASTNVFYRVVFKLP
jgi:hypothetical protein